MVGLIYSLSLLPLLASQVAAQGETWLAKPIDNANVAVTSILVLLSLGQLVIAGLYLFRGRWPHLIPGIIIALGLAFLEIAYALYLVRLLAIFSVSPWTANMTQQQFSSISIAGVFFYEWSDAVIVLGLAFIIRDRYLAYQGREKGLSKSRLPLYIMMGLIGLACLVVVIQTSAYNGLVISQPTGPVRTNSALHRLLAYIRLENRINATVPAFRAASAFLLIPLAMWTRSKIGNDPILNLTLFGITPIMATRAITSIINGVFEARLADPNPRVSSSVDSSAIAFADITLSGLLMFAALCLVCNFFLSLDKWLQPHQGGQELDELPSPLNGGFPAKRLYSNT